MTFIVAIVAVFVLMMIWVGIDMAARKRLGERSRCACDFGERKGERHCAESGDSPCNVDPRTCDAHACPKK